MSQTPYSNTTPPLAEAVALQTSRQAFLICWNNVRDQHLGHCLRQTNDSSLCGCVVGLASIPVGAYVYHVVRSTVYHVCVQHSFIMLGTAQLYHVVCSTLLPYLCAAQCTMFVCSRVRDLMSWIYVRGVTETLGEHIN
jgi:hypothetical protein